MNLIALALKITPLDYIFIIFFLQIVITLPWNLTLSHWGQDFSPGRSSCYYQLFFTLIYPTTFKYIYFKNQYFHIMYLKIQHEKLYKCENCIDLLIQQKAKCYWVVVSLGNLLATPQSGVILLMSGCTLDQLLQIKVWELGISVLKNFEKFPLCKQDWEWFSLCHTLELLMELLKLLIKNPKPHSVWIKSLRLGPNISIF